jgi:hypothetical protein
MIRRKLAEGFVAGGFLLASLGLSPGGPSTDRPWWEAQLRLEVRGTYRVQTGGATYDGDFSCRARWSGGLEKDGPDVLLYNLGAELEEWRIREADLSTTTLAAVTEKDISERPVLRVNYFMRRDQDLEVDFILEGLPVPLSEAPLAFDLLLPSSGENKQNTAGRDYNAGVLKGSNRIYLGGEDLCGRKVEKDFAWSYDSRIWSMEQKEMVSFRNRHTARVTLTIIPRASRRP